MIAALENKLLKSNEMIELKNMDLREVKQQATLDRLEQASERNLITSLQTEKKHLESSLVENCDLKENYRDKNIIM